MNDRTTHMRFDRIVGVLAVCAVLLSACQTRQPFSPFAHLPDDVKDFKQAQFIENRVLVVQTCLPDKKIDVRTLAVEMPDEPMPLTVCKRRAALGQPCPDGWSKSEPEDAGTKFNAVRSVRVWRASGASSDIVRRFLAVGDVKRDPIVNSAGSSHTLLVGTTTAAQPVFEYSFESEAKTVFAWRVTSESLRNGLLQPVNYWFQPPANLRLNEYSDWRPADTEEPSSGAGRSYSVAMANNAAFPKGGAGPGSPYVRFGLMTYRQYQDAQRLWRYEFRHAYLEAAKHLVGDQRERVQVLRSDGTPIPPC